MLLSFLYPAIFALLSLTPESALATKAKAPKNAVLLSNVKSLTLRHGSKTSHRRVPAVPQLQCVGGNAKGLYDVDIMRCTNQGSDYEDENIQWSCTANIPDEFKLGSTDVICEGYDSSDDPYVLKGSCGVEYRLVLTDKGEEKYGRRRDGGSHGPDMQKEASTLFWIVFALVAGWILYSIVSAYLRGDAARRPPRLGGNGGNFWGGGGPGGGDPWDPPPPYPGKRSYTRPGQQQEGWRPGFWSGTAAGAAAGYLAGNRGRQQAPLGRSSWFGGNGGMNYGTNPSAGPIPRSNSGSSSRHESTGFGSTSRR
ncbi:hypothetical protein BP6252_02336 [Coleophoma cylindrospora]|uniref:Store-operated calcium entry-associated regulatory factor n=1 Tax=Coleophoma cylindrospora TaxID=1849047 RepID=A0A3D8SEM5_9HELO|nr:hypothetical protein BP6252_02336 [Coleophoma cylindrospora]